MSMNIAILAIEGSAEEIDQIIPDVYYNTHNKLVFEEAIDPEIDRSLPVTSKDGWVILIDVLGRFVQRENYPLSISKHRKTRLFWLADEPAYREYTEGQKTLDISGKEDIHKILKENNLTPIEQDDDSLILQLMDFQLFGHERTEHGISLEKSKFELYELD